MPDAHRLALLNPEQHRAAVYGMADHEDAHGPLLIIAGAGSGKTETLAHRVAQGPSAMAPILLAFCCSPFHAARRRKWSGAPSAS